MTDTICPTHAKEPWYVAWPLRALGALFLWTSMTLPSSVTLRNTPLVRTIKTAYPTFGAIGKDILVTIIVLGILGVALNKLLRAIKRRRENSSWIRLLTKIDKRFFSQFMGILFFFTHWGIVCMMGLFFWFTIIFLVTSLFPATFSLPAFETQPIIFFMGIVGLGLLIDSINVWQERLAHHFCIRCRF